MESFNTCALLKSHIIKGRFVRSDFFVRLMAIENHYGENDFGIALYNKMQKHKGGKAFNQGKNSFIHIVKSFEENGFISAESNFIIVNKVLRLIAGAHRLACCLYFGIKEIPFYIDLETKKDTVRGVKWFRDKKFSKNGIAKIIAKQKEILDGCL